MHDTVRFRNRRYSPDVRRYAMDMYFPTASEVIFSGAVFLFGGYIMDKNVKKLTSLAMLAAIAFVIVALIRIPAVQFLKYEPKDVIIVIGGFIYGPLASLLISVVVSLVEMVTISSEGIIGCIMNIISTCSFACTASFIYKKNRSIKGAIAGLFSAIIVTCSVMMLWNYLITPIHMGIERDVVAKMLLPTFLPFNLVKGVLNTGITLLVYKSIVRALRRARLIEDAEKPSVEVNVANDSLDASFVDGKAKSATNTKKVSVGVYILGAFLIITGALFILVIRGII